MSTEGDLQQHRDIVIGVLALQGAFQEHINVVNQINGYKECQIKAIPVKTREELENVDGLIIPGGESTAITIVAERTGMWSALEEFIHKYRKPVWGTCAGMILLSKDAKKTKEGGQKLLGALDIVIKRNAFGAQVDSFIADIKIPCLETYSDNLFPGVFIRAPLVDSVSPDGNNNLEILATIESKNTNSSCSDRQDVHSETQQRKLVVAVKQNHVLATAFHPELTQDNRCHLYFIDMIKSHQIEQKPNFERAVR